VTDTEPEQEATGKLGGEPRLQRCRRIRGMRPDADDPRRNRDPFGRCEQEVQTFLEVVVLSAGNPDRAVPKLLELSCSRCDLVYIAFA